METQRLNQSQTQSHERFVEGPSPLKINVGVSGVADDVYLMSDRQTKLQAQLEIASHYGKMYRIKYCAAKTKVTVVGSEIDQNYFIDVKPWIMDNKVVQVVTDNKHLGQIVSGKKSRG